MTVLEAAAADGDKELVLSENLVLGYRRKLHQLRGRQGWQCTLDTLVDA